ncbi:MAG TPA: hypothetical protein VGH16_23415 [Candidatus Binatia bacterium]|jgi:predicted outer membrane repeat protein
MEYFRAYSLSSDAGIVAAWDSVASAAEIPSLRQLIAARGAELFPEFAKRYGEIRALPRSARRALQRRLAQSRELANIPAEWRRKLAYSIAGAALLLALGGAAHAGAIAVTAKTPPDVNADGKCSLIEAIVNANNHATTYSDCPGATAGPNTIMLPKGSQIFKQSVANYGPENLAVPSITSDITISGHGAKITRAKGTPAFLFLHIATGGKLTLQDATVSGFAATASTAGALYNGYRGSLIIENSVISGNTASRAGAISNIGYLKITGSTLSKNSADTHAGAIYSYVNTTTIISNTLITGNTAGRFGGAIYSKYGHVYIDGSTFLKNSVGSAPGYAGGAIHSRHDYLKIDSSLLTTNRAPNGGAIYSINSAGLGVAVHIDGSTLSKNAAGNNGGGVFNHGGSLVLTNSVVSGNKAGMAGGGVYNASPFTFIYTNDTFTKNKAPSGPNYSP